MKMKMKKILFVFAVDNMVDLITNSSSELFILHGNTKEEVIGMVENVYPNYRNEYDEIISISEIENEKLDTYLSYTHSDWKDKFAVSKAFETEPSIFYKNFDKFGKEQYWYGDISDEGYRIVREALPKNMYFLFSIDENPNWEMQESLENIGIRYHLG
jgi:hypothetical protein